MTDAPDIRNRITEVRKMRLGDVAQCPFNWKDHPESQGKAFDGIVREIGWMGVPLAYHSDKVGGLAWADGNMRGKRLPDHVADVALTDLTDEEVKYALLTYDPIAAMAEANREKLGALLQSVQSDDASVQAMLSELAEREGMVFGGNGPPPEDPRPQVDRASEIQEKWQVQTGDLWVIPSKMADGEHRVICGDCTDAAVVEAVMGDKRANMVLTDPPYGVDYSGENKTMYYARGRKGKPRTRIEGDVAIADVVDLSVMALRLIPSPILFLWHAPQFHTEAKDVSEQTGYEVFSVIVWNKNQANFGAMGARYKPKFEMVLACKQDTIPWYGPNNEITVWDIDRLVKNEHHPTQKPVELFERAIGNHTQRREVVTDPFLGSGTTLIACERLGRLGRGVEIEPKYVAVTLERLQGLGLDPQRID